MGKYMRKGKGIREIAVMEVSQVGVRTRARVLAALQIARKLDPTKSSSAIKNHDHENRLKSSCVDCMQTSYLELRSRRLQKVSRCYPKERSSAVPASNTTTANNNDDDDDKDDNSSTNEEEMEESRFIFSDDTTNRSFSHTSNSYRQAITVQKFPEFSAGSRRTRAPSTVANSRTNSGTFSHRNSRARPRSLRRQRGEENCVEIKHVVPPSEGLQSISDEATTEVQIWQMEASFGENVMDNDSRDRRETTPSSNVRGEAETLETPGSTTRCAHSERVQNEARMRFCNGPTSQEIDEFFAGAEEREHRRFAERYNYDTLNDVPLPGRFDWMRLVP